MVDFTTLLERLHDAGVDFVLVGGLAAVSQGAPVTTFDVDIVHRIEEENVARLLSVLSSVNARVRGQGDRILRPTADHLSAVGHNLLMTDLGPLDVLDRIEGDRRYEDLVEHTVEVSFRGRTIPGCCSFGCSQSSNESHASPRTASVSRSSKQPCA